MKEGVIMNACCISACSFDLFGVMLMSVCMVKHDVYLSNVFLYVVLYILVQKKC